MDHERYSVFHGLSTDAVPSNMKAAVGRRYGSLSRRGDGRADSSARAAERPGGLQIRYLLLKAMGAFGEGRLGQ